MTAESVDQLRELQAANLVVNAKAAKVHLAALDEIRHEQEEGNELLRESNYLLGNMLDALEDIGAEVAEVHNAVDRQTEMQRAAFHTIHEDLTQISEQLLQMHKTLKNIEDVLRRPYEPKVLELRNQATRWLESGAKNSGREQKDDFEDAFRLLDEIIKNPVGNQDYVTWFQIGWLRWKHYQDIPSAEQAFYRAMRLSAPNADLYHVKSLRHWAYMHYLLEKHEDAYQAIQRALAINRDHDVLFDAARYASCTGRQDEALQLLDSCIDLQPTTIVEMYAEEDFR